MMGFHLQDILILPVAKCHIPELDVHAARAGRQVHCVWPVCDLRTPHSKLCQIGGRRASLSN